MSNVSGLIVPKLCHTRHDGTISCLEPVAPPVHHHDNYGCGEDEEVQNKEEPVAINRFSPTIQAVLSTTEQVDTRLWHSNETFISQTIASV